MEPADNATFFKTIDISLYEIVEYFSSKEISIREGEEILKAGWYAFGLSPPPSIDEVNGLVIAATTDSSKSYEVKLKHLTQNQEHWVVTCSCKAGNGSRCKHVAACLIQINKQPNLQQFSSTDLTQKWEKAGKEFVQQYNAAGALELCPIAMRRRQCIKDDIVTKEMEKEILNELLKANPDSILAKLVFGP